MGSEKNLRRLSKPPMDSLPNISRETLHEYEDSLWEDSHTLADSLRYPSSILEVDSKTGTWKIKRHSGAPSTTSIRNSNASQPSLWSPDRDTYIEDEAPPVPPLPDWPLRESEMPRGYIPVMEHRNQRSLVHSDRSNEIEAHDYNTTDMSDAIAEAIAKLEENSTANTTQKRGENTDFSLPDNDAITPLEGRPGPAPTMQIPRAYRPGSTRAGLPNPFSPASGSASGSASPVASQSWTQRYGPGVGVPRKHDIGPYPPPSSGGTSFATAKAEEEFSRFSAVAPLRKEGDEEKEPGRVTGEES
jgi:hypothetical protein